MFTNPRTLVKIQITAYEIERFKKTQPVLCLSGGSDSVFLFHELVRLSKEHDFSFLCVHFNHKLRGEESERDELFVKNLCSEFGIELKVFSRSFKNFKGNMQNKARIWRYKTCANSKFFKSSVFLTAHHFDDLVEGLVLHHQRGSGVKGVRGMKRWSFWSLTRKRRLILFRPLLQIQKHDIVSSLKNRHLEFCYDSSNNSLKYDRNKLRQLLDQSQWSSSAKDQLIQSTRRLDFCYEYFSERANHLCKRAGVNWQPQFLWDQRPQLLNFIFMQKLVRERGFKQQFEHKHFKLLTTKMESVELGPVKLTHDTSGFHVLSSGALQAEKIQVLKTSGCVYKGDSDLMIVLSQVNESLSLETVNPHESFFSKSTKRKQPIKKIFSALGIPRFLRRIWPVVKNQNCEVVAVAQKASESSFKYLVIAD